MTTPFAFTTLATPGGDEAAVVVGDRHYLLSVLFPDWRPAGLRAHLDHWDEVLERTAELLQSSEGAPPQDLEPVMEPHVLSPVRFPNKLVCVGGVYRDHLVQMGLPAQRWPRMPMFLRPPTTSIVGPGRTIRIPSMTTQLDWEIELAVVIGRRLRDASDVEALAGIAGYSVGIDFGCRDLLDRGSPIGVDLVRAKAQDTLAPIGPVVVPARFVKDPQDLKLRLWVNDQQRQDGSTSDMLYPVREQVATVSRYITLEAGDVIFTGSPAGSARHDEEYLKPGDRVVAEIVGIGTLAVEIYADGGERTQII